MFSHTGINSKLITYNLNVIPTIATSSNYNTYTYTDASNNTYKVYSFMHSGTSETQTSYNIDIPQSTTKIIFSVFEKNVQ